jgi:hypothetical protein
MAWERFANGVPETVPVGPAHAVPVGAPSLTSLCRKIMLKVGPVLPTRREDLTVDGETCEQCFSLVYGARSR